MEKKIVLLDLNDTINECGAKFWHLHEQLFHERVNPQDVTDWDLAMFSSRGKDVYQLFTEPGFYRDIPLKPYAKDFVSNLQKHYDVYFVTDAPSGTSHCSQGNEHANPVADKRKWVEEHFPFFDSSKIIFTSHKWLITGDVLVDDKPETFYEYEKRNRNIILMDAPHNRHIETTKRVSSLREAEQMIWELLNN